MKRPRLVLWSVLGIVFAIFSGLCFAAAWLFVLPRTITANDKDRVAAGMTPLQVRLNLGPPDAYYGHPVVKWWRYDCEGAEDVAGDFIKVSIEGDRVSDVKMDSLFE